MTSLVSTRLRWSASLLLVLLAAVGCSDGDARNEDADATPIHLEDRIGSAEITGGEVPTDLRPAQRWDFAGDARGWKTLPTVVPGSVPARVETGTEGLVVTLAEGNLPAEGSGTYGGIYLAVDELDLDAWTHAVVEIRTDGEVRDTGIGYNLRTEAGELPEDRWPTHSYAQGPGVVPADGEAHTVRIPLIGRDGPPEGPIREIALELGADAPTSIEILSFTLLPADAAYATDGIGVRSVSSSRHEGFGPHRRALYVHAPTRLSYPVRIPEAGHLALGLGARSGAARMTVEIEADGASRTLVDETVAPGEAWLQQSLDLGQWSGRDVVLTLAAERVEEDEPAVALWTAPTLSSAAPGTGRRPNVVFYVIDGASAGQMSVFGYERPTTPNLERIAAEGVVFEQAHSNSTWTMPSTASFMTSLHHSVFGGLRNDVNPVPPNARTMAEHFHDAGFHTGVFTMNPNAGAFSGLDRSVDVMRDFAKRGAMGPDPIESISSTVLQGQYWEWRDAYPGPYWVHFQTTDVHPPYHPPEPFEGRIVSTERSDELTEQMMSMEFPFRHDSASVHEHFREQLEKKNLDPHTFYATMRDVHDEAMMHQDQRLGELVEELKARGEWENTLLVIGSDHGHPAASYPRFGRGLLDPQPPVWEGALLGEFESHVPLIFVWPGGIEGGRRIAEPVSMIDVLPTLLDLVGLPAPEIAQGRSLVPLLRGEEGWEPRPVVFDEFRVTAGDDLIGNLELLDGRWGMSLEIRTVDQAATPELGRHPAPAGGRWNAHEFPEQPRFLLYDLEADPLAVHNVTAEHPEVAAAAERRLWRIWQEHRALAARFEAGGETELTPEQIRSLQALGYIQ